ncbi:outer membrane beta-barrel protein [Flavobacteriaceae bacterium SZ-1-7]|uniref:outer membrane beta-barrel protein n=1 Tax=Tamlana sedimenti TaxID=3134126 RepID=UPI0031243BA2
MKNQIILIFTTILSLNCFSQISFENGYYIDNNNQKINCLIKNVVWENNPTEFEYKLDENVETKTAVLKYVKEFGINNTSKFIREIVNIDRSSEKINKISIEKNPLFNKEEVFLKVLVEGSANLYMFRDKDVTRFFYSKENSNIKPLIFKSYITQNDKIAKNHHFKQQLWNDLKCPTLTTNKIERVDYHKDELANIFTEYNKCNNQEYTNYEAKKNKDFFNLSIRPGINKSTLAIQNNLINNVNTEFGNDLAFRFGIEGEFILPFRNNKWSIIVEPTYQYFKSEKTLPNRTANVDYTSVELPFGLRHYFFLNDNSKIFINCSYSLDFNKKNSIIEYNSTKAGYSSFDLNIKSGSNLAFGMGYKYNDKYSLELRYQTKRDVLSRYIYWATDYNTASLIFGYTVF